MKKLLAVLFIFTPFSATAQEDMSFGHNLHMLDDTPPQQYVEEKKLDQRELDMEYDRAMDKALEQDSQREGNAHSAKYWKDKARQDQ